MTRAPSHVSIKEKKREFFSDVIQILRGYCMPYPSKEDPHTIAANAFQDFIDGKFDSLDKAFGLINLEGCPESDESYKKEIVFRALDENSKGVAWTKMPEHLNIKIDERTIRKWRDEDPIPEIGGKGRLHVLYLLSRA